MSDLIVIQPQVTQLEITEIDNTVTVASVGVQGPKGDTGATGPKGDTGAQGSSGVIAVTAPITNSGTSTSANIGVSAGSTTAAGVLQLTDSTSSTSTTTAATPNAVKSAYDLANNALLKYATPWQVKYRSTYWYESRNGSTITTSVFVQNRVYCYPLFVSESITIDRLGVECVTANASTTWRIGIYNSDSNGVPSTVLLDAGTVDTSTIGLKTITVNQTLSAGLYFIAGVWQGGSASPTMRSYSASSGNWAPIASTTQQSSGYSNEYHVDSITGSLGTISAPAIGSLSQTRTQFRIA